jgi:Histidine phosphatase superfamily (branch 1)
MTEPNVDIAPPGSSESFNQFKDRTLSTISNYVKNGQNENTVIVTHSKPIRVWDAWEHGGFANDIHQSTYDKEDCVQPGGHQEISMPAHVQYQGALATDQGVVNMFGGAPLQHLQDESSNSDYIKEQMDDARNIAANRMKAATFHSNILHHVPVDKPDTSLDFPGDNMPILGPDLQGRVSVEGQQGKYIPVAEDPDAKYRAMLGVRPGMESGGGSSIPEVRGNKDLIFDLNDQGKTDTEIAKHVEVSRPYVSRLLRDAGKISNYEGTVETIRSERIAQVTGYPPANKGSIWEDQKTNDKLVDLFNQGLSPVNVAKEMKITPGQASGRIKRINDWNKTQRALDQTKLSEMSPLQIKEHFGLSNADANKVNKRIK